MGHFENSVNTLFEQIVRLVQLVGIPVMGVICLIGMLVLLTSGKNPRRKRAGYILSIGFGLGILLVAYVPVLYYKFSGGTPKTATGDETIVSMVDSSAGIGVTLFQGIQYGTIPLTFTMFYIGMLILLLAAKSPQRKRLGIGIMIMSPLVLAAAFVIPKLLPHL